MNKTEYIHPEKYEGVLIRSDLGNKILKQRVENYCLRCDLFMGKEHDFSECRLHDVWENGKVSQRKTCPFENMGGSLIDPQVKYESEGE